MIIQRFNLNLIPNQSPVIVHVNQYDTGTGRLIATLYEGNEPYSPNGTAVIQGTKPDGHGFQYTATLDGNVVTADLTEQMSPVAGDVRAQIVVTESSGVTGTFVFIMRVQPSALPSDTDMSESDYQYIEEAIREAQEAVHTAQEATETAQEAVERAQEAITETQENAEDSEAWAQGTRGGIPVEPTDPTYEHNAEYWAQYAERYAQGGLHYKGSILFANIPTTGMREGDMYDITDDFTTDSRFTEGAGIEVKGGTNIAWNSDNKWDILALPYIPKTTFNGRSGSILPMAGDYDSKKILLSSALHIGGETQNDVQEALEALSDDGVKLFNGRSGSVLPMAGDYDSEKILLTSVLHIGGETQDNVQKALEALEGNKADKVDNAIADNFAGLDANGNLKDSGKKASDFAIPSDIAGQQSLVKDTVGWTGKNKFPLTLSNLKSINTSGTWGGNSYTHNNVTYTITAENDIVTNIASSGTASTSGGSNLFLWANDIPSWMDADKDYILSGCASDGSVSTYSIQYNNWTEGAVYQKIDDGNGVTIRKITDSTTQKIRIWIRQNVDASGLNFKPMVRDASITDPTYEPYHESVEEEIEQIYADNGVLGAKNLLPNNATSQTINGVTFTVNDDGSVTANGTATATTNFALKMTPEFDGAVILSGCPSGGDANKYSIQYSSWVSGQPIYADYGEGVLIPNVFDKNTYPNTRVFINIGNGVTLNNLTFYPMLRLASDPDDTYQPYAMTNKELTSKLISEITPSIQRIQLTDLISSFNLISTNDISNFKRIGKLVVFTLQANNNAEIPQYTNIFNSGVIRSEFLPSSGWAYGQMVIGKADGTPYKIAPMQISYDGRLIFGATIEANWQCIYQATYILP